MKNIFHLLFAFNIAALVYCLIAYFHRMMAVIPMFIASAKSDKEFKFEFVFGPVSYAIVILSASLAYIVTQIF